MRKAQRLVQLIMTINARRSFTVKELAEQFGLSTRTIARDLLELEELGVPIYAVQGRGGGYRLLRERMLPPISFTEDEAVAIYLASKALEHYAALPFEGADTALRKFYHYLPSDAQRRVDRIRERVMLWSPYRPMSADVLRTLLEAVMDRKVVTIAYRSERGVTERDIQPIGLYAGAGYWYCPAYCFLRGELRQFRADRIASAVLNETVSGREDVDKLTIEDRPETGSVGGEDTVPLAFSLTPRGAWLLAADGRFAPHIRQTDEGAEASMPIARSDLPFYIDRIWALGEEARVTGPAEAVAAMKRKVRAMNGLYG